MTDIRISTMTKVGKLSDKFDLKDLYEQLNIDDQITYIEYGDSKPKGVNHKKKKIKAKVDKKRKNYFYNQLSLLLDCEKSINIKIFNNGSFQMTGIKNDRMSYDAVDILIRKISDIYEHLSLKIISMETVMVNSDFDYNYSLNNNKLHELIEKHNYYSSYEPCTYPGVNIKYYHNPTQKINFGTCQCDGICNGKGLNGDCRRITIAAFKSGKIIITGKVQVEQLYIAKDFITNFIYDNKEEILLNYLKYIKMIQKNYRIYKLRTKYK
jgi:TATA-box binding protein (TBP) (component of TFIID and TFIIIB)